MKKELVNKNCLKCQKEFTVSVRPSEYKKNYCSRVCANSRSWSEDDKRKKSLANGGTGEIKVKKEKLERTKRKLRIKKKCLNCEKETKNKLYCTASCSQEARVKLQVENDSVLFNQGLLTYRSKIYNLLVKRDSNKCTVCGISEWQGKTIRLWVDHIDGNATNNSPNNFRLICPNCDSQSKTFGAKNKGKGRKARGLKTYS